uniref:Acetyltransferase (GNAT) domain-containing protein n=1 Tax=Candidatus Kentrum sp. FM TaxID=2126340 RepID=A0A450S3L6_9GAMM|nr:MAG: Acetyltransferase (GNAT) domain-containing protein [Candidatus Kentron sp. FM]VFJ49556.1 MAG: Acetyltransferase (GNAT) domain-containing protein [Candidatus Kentron sp. FM]VFK07281.1 MAG: Acetyltransferase (GNAT) domain-containing protein [Candidatus Kentron sp. FM]
MSLEVIRSQADYRAFCAEEASIPLFSQAWWLDAVAGPQAWDAVLAIRGDTVIGAHPYVIRHRFGLTYLGQPKLTQTLGPWVRASQAKYAKSLGVEKDILGALADGLPDLALYHQNWHCARTNWLPFYWRGYRQTTRYTYRLELATDEKLWTSVQSNIRREIRKAEKRFGVTVKPAKDLDEFLALNRKTFERQRKSLPYTERLVHRIDEAAKARDARDVLVAQAPDGTLHAGVYIVRDARTAYYLMGGGDPDYRNSGAGSLCMWEAIRSQPEYIETFDFEGSMIEPVERFFRGFGARQIPYFQVTRADSRLLQAALCVRELLKGIP